MAAKKNFDNLNTNAVYNKIAEATAEPIPVKETPKSEKEPKRRVNMEFKMSNYEYIQTMAGIKKQTVTEYLNSLIEKNMKENEQLYKQIQALQTDNL